MAKSPAKPRRALMVQLNWIKGRLYLSPSFFPLDSLEYRKPSDFVNFYSFGGTRYDITILSAAPSIHFDRDYALKLAIQYASGGLVVYRLNLNTGNAARAVYDIETETVKHIEDLAAYPVLHSL